LTSLFCSITKAIDSNNMAVMQKSVKYGKGVP